ncbi:MAG: hypothetical protein ACLP7Q_14065 [Isosphaeraceae bacterium]
MRMRLDAHFAVVCLMLVPPLACAQQAPSDGPAGRGTVQVDLPPGWQSKLPPVTTAVQFAVHEDAAAYFELVVEPRSDFAKSDDLMAYARLAKEAIAKQSKLVNRRETDLQERSIAGRATAEYEITGETGGVRLHYRIIILSFGGYFCRLVCWTTPSHWQEAQEKFDELVSRLK